MCPVDDTCDWTLGKSGLNLLGGEYSRWRTHGSEFKGHGWKHQSPIA